MADNEKTYLLKVELDASALEKGAKNAEKELSKLIPQLQQMKEQGKQNTVEYVKLQQEIKKYNRELADNSKALNTLSKEQATSATNSAKQSTSITDMKAQILAANIAYKSLTEEEKKNSQVGEKLADDIRKISVALKNEEQSLKTNAGALKAVATSGMSFEDQLKRINTIVKDSPVSILEMNKQIQAYQSLALQAGRNSPVGREALAQAAALKDKYVDIQNETKRLADDQKNLKGVIEIGKGVVAGYGALQAAQAIVGNESEALRETFIKLQAAQTALTSLDALRTSLQKESNAMLLINNIRTKAAAVAQLVYAKAVGESTGAMKGFRTALLATGIGAIIALIGTAVANWDKLKGAIMGNTIAQDALNETVDQYKEGAKDAIIQTSKVEAAFKLAKNGVISKEEALQTYNDTLGDAFGKMDNLNDAEAVFAAKTKAFVEAAGLRAQSTALFEKAAEEQANALAATLENQVGFWDQFTSSFGQGWNIATGNTEGFWKTQNKLQEDAVAELKKTSNERSKIFTEEAQRLLMEAETIENANDISNDSEKELEEERKKRFEEWKKRQDEYLKGAEELALTLRDSLLGETELTLSNQRKAIEAHYAFLEKAARNNTDALIQISEAKNSDLARIESEEKAAARKQIEISYADEIKAAEKKYNDLANLAKKNGNDITQIKADETALITSLTEQMNSELESVELDFNNRRVQREFDFIAEVEDLNKSREESTKAALNEIEIAEKELALELSKGTKQEESRWQDLQRVKIQQLQKANAEVINNEQLTAAERLAIVAENELAIQRLRNETFEHNKQLSEQSNASQLSLATSFVSSAQSLSDGYFQLQQNQLQQQLNDITEQYDYEAKLLQDKLDAGLISQAEFNAKKSALDAEQAAKESKLKREQWKKERQQKYISAILNTALGVTSALTTQPFMPLGIIAAATAAALGGFQVAAIASEPEPKFAKGTAIQSGIFGGKSHAQGGVKLSADGVPFGEAEKDEIFVILNKNAKNHLNTLSNLNESTGGVSFTGGKKMARGGLMKFQSGVALSATAPALSQSAENKFQQENAVIQAVANMPNPIVFVEDMTAKQSNQVEIRSRADV